MSSWPWLRSSSSTIEHRILNTSSSRCIKSASGTVWSFRPRALSGQGRSALGESQENQKDIFFRTSSSSIGRVLVRPELGTAAASMAQERLTFAEEFSRDVEHFEFRPLGPSTISARDQRHSSLVLENVVLKG